MNLTDLIRRHSPIAWQDSEKIPWNEPDFSRRMLESHLSQDHDWASRRHTIIDRHVHWIADRLSGKNVNILDLGCGPGFYTQRLAELGLSCTGVDFSPASIEYARKQAEQSDLRIEYVLQDIRTFTTDQTFDAVLLTFGEFNVFKESDAVAILKKASSFLKPNGFLLLEAHTFEIVKSIGSSPVIWQAMESGVFSDTPHLCLQENFWDESASTATTRYFIVDTETSNVQKYGSSMKAYSEEEYRLMFRDADFIDIETLNAADWPTGDDFKDKLQTYICSKIEQ
ncbi:MAG: class I SAM-dependent methyltransferase [Planctomycetaceae bacterium]|jgi:ubiquinone/menaquinone biosynthesis C-methylase UbiE|nr:class I SAM-dependent methyltransferase [Planctomycetaceae bacterium]